MTQHFEHATLARLTTEIVAAYVAHNPVAPSDLAKLIGAVASQLQALDREAEPEAPSAPAPAVPVRRSIQPDHLVCLVCGKKQKLLKRHIAVEHDLTPRHYRETFGLKPDYPMVAPKYRQQRRELALQIGLGQPRKPQRRRRKATRSGSADAAESGS